MRITSNELGLQAYQIVKEMNISQELKPGQKIIQEKLAEDLGISRTPFRSALEMLESESFVESLPRRGMIVKALSAKKYGYNKFFTADASPHIFDMLGFFRQHTEMNKAIWNLVSHLDRDKYRKLMAEEKYMGLMTFVRKEIYRL